MEPSIKTFKSSYFAKKLDTLHKSHNLGNRFLNINDSVTYDDMILWQDVPRFQISEIFLLSNENYVYGFKIIYYNPLTNNYYAGADYKVDGIPLKIRHALQKKSIKLAEDDYLVEIKVRSGAVIDFLKFQTKKGLILEGGGSGGGEFVKKSKSDKDYYFSNFGGTLDVNSGCLNAIHFEEIPFQTVDIKVKGNIDFQTFRRILKMVVEYLPLQDSVKIFTLNSHLYLLRRDPHCFRCLTELVLKSLNNQHRRYIKNLAAKEEMYDDEAFAYATSLIKKTSNKIKNAYGQFGWENWNKTGEGFAIETFLTQPYRTHCFAGTHYNSEVSIELLINEIFEQEFIKELITGNNVIFAGGCIARRPDCPSKGFIQFEVFESGGEIIFKEKKKKKELLPEYQIMVIRYQAEKGKIPHKVKLTFGGHDLKSWAGNYGPRFSGLFIRGYKANF